MADTEGNESAPPAEDTSRLGRFIMRYHTFLSSFVIGVAGLIATSIWQFRQADTTRDQAIAQQRVAETSAENSWKITRADILSKNLSILATNSPENASQRYGVLLSLTRAEIIDPDLAVSYALELGKDNAEDMLTVLASTKHKDYNRLARAYGMSCEEKYGVTRSFDVCVDKLADRTAALGRLFADDVTTALAGGDKGPMVLLDNERDVQAQVQLYVGLFETAIDQMYDQRQWDAITKFAAYAPGAHLVSALVLAGARTGEFVTEDEEKQLAVFHDEQTKWLTDYFAGKSCEAECKGHMLNVMISHYQEAQGDFDAALKALLLSPRSQSRAAISRLHARLLWCQVDDSDMAPLRDHALVPAAEQVLATPATDAAVRQAVISLLAVVTPPAATADPATVTAWTNLQVHIARADPKIGKLLKDRQAFAAHQRVSPPPALKALDFCTATAADTPDVTPPAP